ncbi:MAG TPA: hypothetical protein VLB84_18355 [Bacteroidia bacterium]|nr:hypothetical protein [Bacteroidia bacterium]
MKKMLGIIGIICSVFIITGCKKEYSCVCTNPGGSEVVFTVKQTKDKAKKKCDDYYNENIANIPWNETVCAIK